MGRDPIENCAEDIRLAKLIRRANLDALWPTKPGTIKRTLAEAKGGLAIASTLGFSPSYSNLWDLFQLRIVWVWELL
jgi:hypothetical protein